MLTKIDEETSPQITTIHVICDNLSVQAGKLTRTWLAKHLRFKMHFTPVHCSWMNQVEQWLSILQRKRLRARNFADLADLEAKILAFIDEWNEQAHPFGWTAKSFDKVLNAVDSVAPTPAALDRRPQEGRVMATNLRGAVLSGFPNRSTRSAEISVALHSYS